MPVTLDMEELQLALTASRVDQKNYGLWIKSWQVGQVLQALVVDKAPSGNLVLRVDGHKITATSDIPVQKGAVLMLEVTGLKPDVSVKIVNGPIQEHSSVNLLNGQLQLLMPRQSAVLTPLLSLLSAGANANILAFLGIKPDLIDRLSKSLVKFEGLTQSAPLQKALQQSGFFLESQLLQLVLGGGVFPHGDIKGLLLRALSKVNRSLGDLDDEGFDATEPGDLPTGNAQAVNLDRTLLLNLQTELEGAIATITLNQLTASQADERGMGVWMFEVPYILRDATGTLSVKIKLENSAAESPEQQDWKVLLSTSLPRAGMVEAELFLRASKVSVVIYSEEQMIAALIDSQLSQLRSGLESRGLDVSVLLCHQGVRPQDAQPERWHQCVDEEA